MSKICYPLCLQCNSIYPKADSPNAVCKRCNVPMTLRTFVREPNPTRIIASIGAILVIVLTVNTFEWLKFHIKFLSYVLGVFALISITYLLASFCSFITQGPKFFTRLRLDNNVNDNVSQNPS